MTGVWILAALVAAAAAAVIAERARRGPARGSGANPDVAVYQRALAEIDDLAKRDLLAADELAATRAEAGRRLLRAAGKPRSPAARPVRPAILLLAALAAPMGALALYQILGSPRAKDQPFASRLEQWRAHPEQSSAPELAAALRAVAAERPTDPEPLRRLALLELSMGDPDAAAHDLRKAVRVAPSHTDLLEMLGEVLVFRARGVVGPDAQAVFHQVVGTNPASPTARYYLARAQIAGGDTEGGVAAWRGLLSSLAMNDPRRGLLTNDIARVERTGMVAGAETESQARSPDLDRAIAGMVDSLADRLASNPDDPQGWVRLVRAYGVLGESEKQSAALAKARMLYARRSDILEELRSAATPSS
jgi:cytochrome c-type biogenesis protein CcmH